MDLAELKRATRFRRAEDAHAVGFSRVEQSVGHVARILGADPLEVGQVDGAADEILA